MYTIRKLGKRGVLFSTDTITGCLTFCYLIQGKKANYVVDTGLGSGTAGLVQDYIRKNHPGKVIVINTHYHWDHLWGNIGFEGNDIYAHRSCRDMIEQKWDEMEQKQSQWKEGQIKKVLPNRLIDDHFIFEEDGIDLFYTPGHTADSLSVYDCVDRVLHVGDNMETPYPGVYDTKEHLVYSLKKCLEYDFSHSVSGHNGNVTREDIQEVIKANE